MMQWRRPAVPALMILLALLPALARAQGNAALWSRDGLDVWAVGDSGRFYRSLDGGAGWSYGNLGTKPLRGVTARGLRVVVVGDSGQVWSSANSGGAWTRTVPAGVLSLRTVDFPTDSVGYVAGEGGTLLKTVDAGANWTAQASGTGQLLTALRFTDAQHGWVVGTGGFAARTSDGGANWDPVALGTTNELTAVDQRGSTVWIVGAYGVAFRSTTGGLGWTQFNLRLDGRADVKAVWLQSPDTVLIAGGGGFLRRSVDGGATWTFPQHALHGQISDLHFVGPLGWATSSRTRAVLRTTDGGATWAFPAGVTVTRAWAAKLTPGATVRGSSLTSNPQNRNTLFCVLGGQLYRSRDEGETWQAQGNPIGCDRTNAFAVSPKDSNVFLVASVFTTSPTRRVMKSTDGGLTWTQQLAHAFGEYGIPMEVHPDRPDTVFFGGDSDSLYRSLDFGKTWTKWGNQLFRSPCDLVVVPDSGNIVQVGDGITGSGQGQIYRSTDDGLNFSLRWTNPGSGSEIPGMSNARLRNGATFATNWSSGGVMRSTDYGLNWTQVSTASSAWGTDAARDDPNVVLFGVYSGGLSYLSLDGGSSFTAIPLSNANYSFYARDRGLLLAEQSNGIWKLSATYAFVPNNTQSLAVTAPNGGESWSAGSLHTIAWNAANVALARIEWRQGPADPWHLVAEVEGYRGSYGWTVPLVATTTAEVRVSDAADAAPSDVSNAPFTIALPVLAVAPDTLDFGTHPVGSSARLALTLSNGGTGPLTVSSAATATSRFHTGRPSLTLAAGASDTLGVWFEPVLAGAWTDTVLIASDALLTPAVRVPLQGVGADTVAAAPHLVIAPDTLDFGVVELGAVRDSVLQLSNTGTASAIVSAVGSSNARFWAWRGGLTLTAGAGDTLGVSFSPLAEGPDTATVTFVSNDAASPQHVVLRGTGRRTVGVEARSPVAFALLQNVPNPATGITTIRYALPRRSDVDLAVFDLQGHRVATLARGAQEPGWYTVRFGDPQAPLSAGVYFYRLQAGGFTSTRKLLVVR